LNGKRFETDPSEKLQGVIRDLLRPENGYVTRLAGKQLEDGSVSRFVAALRRQFMGDLLDTSWSAGKPVNVLPEPYFKSYLTRELLSRQEARDSIDFDNYIHEVDLYLNSSANQSEDPYHLAARQFVFPGNTLPQSGEIDWASLASFIRHISRYKITAVQVSGSDILAYSSFGNLRDLLDQAGLPVHYHLKAEFFEPSAVQTILNQKDTKVAIHFTFPLDLDNLNRILTGLSSLSGIKKLDFQFAVASGPELEMAREIISKANLPNAFLNPYYNGNNFDFFRDTVFITRDDIAGSKPNQNQVFSRITVNETDFGKFTVLPDSTIYANLNDPPVAKLGEIATEEMILNELLDGNSWSRTRKGVTPCKDCLYHFLCPPVSSYELLMKRFNFCHVYPLREET
jgi:pseudo-rSAM protein